MISNKLESRMIRAKLESSIRIKPLDVERSPWWTKDHFEKTTRRWIAKTEKQLWPLEVNRNKLTSIFRDRYTKSTKSLTFIGQPQCRSLQQDLEKFDREPRAHLLDKKQHSREQLLEYRELFSRKTRNPLLYKKLNLKQTKNQREKVKENE